MVVVIVIVVLVLFLALLCQTGCKVGKVFFLFISTLIFRNSRSAAVSCSS